MKKLFGIFSCLLLVANCFAADGTWSGDSGNWSDTTKWTGGIIADGEDSTAFTSVNNNRTITLDSNRTIGHISFSQGSTTVYTHTIDGTNILTLAVSSGTPTIKNNYRNRISVISASIDGDDGLEIAKGADVATGIIVLSGNNTYSGVTKLTSGTLHIGSDTALGTSSITFNGGGLASSDATARTFTNTIALTANPIIGKGYSANADPGTGALTFSDTAATALGATRTFTIDSGLRATFAQAFSGSFGINKAGAGTLVLSGASTYDGVTTIQASGGTIEISSIGSVNGSASSLGIPTTAANGKITIYNGCALVYTGSAATTDRQLASIGVTSTFTVDQSGTGLLKFTSAISPGSSGGLITLNLQGSTAGTGEISGVIPNTSGTRLTAVTKAGTGTWTLSGTNTYTGVTTINAGVLQLGSGASGGDGALASPSITNNAALVFNTYASQSYTGVVSGAGTVTKLGSGKLTLSGARTYTGITEIQAGKLVANGSHTQAGSYKVNPPLPGSGTSEAVLSGSGSISLAAAAVEAEGSYSSESNYSIATVSAGVSNDTATLTIAASNLNFKAGSRYTVEISTNNCDKIAVTGDLVISGSGSMLPELKLINLGGAWNGNSHVILTYTGTRSGQFGTVTGLAADYMVDYDDVAKSISVRRAGTAALYQIF